MHSHAVLVAEGLALGVNRAEGQCRRAERVDAFLRRDPGVGSPTNETHVLGQEAIGRTGDPHRPLVLGRIAGVDHHGHIYVVEVTQFDQFGLAAEKRDLAFLDQS